jgi:integrase/recombinase XerD
MGALRERMEREMGLRRMAFRTRRSYADAVAALARHYRRSPDRLTQEEIQSYLLYLIEERKLAPQQLPGGAARIAFLLPRDAQA